MMPTCESTLENIFPYLDGELAAESRRDIEAHLESCAACRNAAEGRRAFLEKLACARPEIRAPRDLRQRVQAVVRTEKRGWRAWLGSLATPVRPYQAVLASAVLVTFLAGVWLTQVGRRPRSEFAAAALAAHRQRLAGTLPLAMQSSSPELVSAFFQKQIPVHVNLPQNQPASLQTIPYEIEGARVVHMTPGVDVGLVSYQVNGHSVSLVIAPASAVELDGRRQVPMKSLRIHYDSGAGFHIVTWAVPRKGVTYALVSDSSRPENEACVICHAGPKDRAFMSALLN